ncbi:hypothetical protein D3C83_109510 [compost metagenome]
MPRSQPNTCCERVAAPIAPTSIAGTAATVRQPRVSSGSAMPQRTKATAALAFIVIGP